MESKISCLVKLNQDEISKGGFLSILVDEVFLNQNQNGEYELNLKHTVKLHKEQDIYKPEDLVSSVEIEPKISEESDVFIIYELLNEETVRTHGESEHETFSDFLKNKIFVTYDYGDEKIVLMMETDRKSTRLNSSHT